jgi:hypothetical protein
MRISTLATELLVAFGMSVHRISGSVMFAFSSGTNHLHCGNELSAKPHVATCYTSGQATKCP